LTPAEGSGSFEGPPAALFGPSDAIVADALRTQIQDALNRARKERDRHRTLVLSTTLSEVRNQEIHEGGEAGDETVREVVARAVKQRREAAELMRSGGREELARREEEEAAILAEFLPPPLEEPEVRAMIREIVADGADQMGPVMGRLMPRIKGRFDGKEANRLVREELEA
jgi:uncharacterized protein